MRQSSDIDSSRHLRQVYLLERLNLTLKVYNFVSSVCSLRLLDSDLSNIIMSFTAIGEARAVFDDESALERPDFNLVAMDRAAGQRPWDFITQLLLAGAEMVKRSSFKTIICCDSWGQVAMLRHFLAARGLHQVLYLTAHCNTAEVIDTYNALHDGILVLWPCDPSGKQLVYP
jgi:hypothetical protein